VRSTKLIKVGTLVAVSALALTACAGKSKTPAAGGPTSAAGGSTSSAASDKPVIEIGVQGPLSGDNQALGINIDWGVKLAIQQANDKGDLPFTLKVKESDDQGDQAKGPDAARLLIQDTKVLGVVGPAFSGPTAASGKLYTDANLATVSPSATRPSLTTSGFKSFFRVVANDSVQGPAAADYLAKSLKAKKVFVIDDKTQYGTGLASAIKDQLTKDGVEVVSDSAPQKTSDYAPLASKVVSSGATAMYYAGYYADGGIFAKALKTVGFTGTMISGDGSKDPNFVTTAGKDSAEGWQFTCPCLDAGKDPKFADFSSAYKALSNAEPGTYSIEGYDAATVLLAGIDKGKTTRADLLSWVKDYDADGLSKHYKWDAKGELQAPAVYGYKVENGKIVPIGPIGE